jgi:LSD1 subclass zinc finger protein
MERASTNGMTAIRAAEYAPRFAAAKHLFLAGDLRQPNPHPFFRDPRVEIIACKYDAGDGGLYHWHAVVTEYEYVLEGSVSYVEAATGALHRFEPGDLTLIPAGVCVRRIVDQPCRTLALKIPSSAEKVHCAQCTRECPSRQELYGGTP